MSNGFSIEVLFHFVLFPSLPPLLLPPSILTSFPRSSGRAQLPTLLVGGDVLVWHCDGSASSVISRGALGSYKTHYLAPHTTIPKTLHGNQAAWRTIQRLGTPSPEHQLRPRRFCIVSQDPSKAVACSTTSRAKWFVRPTRTAASSSRNAHSTGPVRYSERIPSRGFQTLCSRSSELKLASLP